MINKELELTIEATIRDASTRRHEYLTVEHLLYAVLHDEWGIEIIIGCGGDVERLKANVEEFFSKHVPLIPQAEKTHPQPTLAFQKVIRRAILHIKSAAKPEADSGDILASILLEEESHAENLLKNEGITRIDVLNFISHGISKYNIDTPSGDTEAEPAAKHEKKTGKDPLQAFTVDLIEKAKSGQIDPLVSREAEIKRTVQVLSRRRKNNVILVGEPGVGKTAIVEGLALKMHRGEVPAALNASRIFSLDMGSILAGTRYRGDFEARLKATIAAVEKIDGAVLFIDEIHTIVGAGATSGGSMDASNILKPVLNSGRMRCIGASTYEEFKNHFEKDRALSRRFQKIEIQEPAVHETINILKGLKSYYEKFHGVHYTSGAIKTAAELASKYINDRFLPDKAIDVIDEAGARLKLSPQYKLKKTVGNAEVEKVVADIAKIPPRTVSTNDIEKLKTLENELTSVVFGQDSAIHSLASAIKRSRAGLGSPEKPVGSFLFTGPTGVGKTEVSKQLANILGVKFIRFDMSEYMEKHTVARLIGAPPGYVGFDQAGLLTDSVRKHPYSVILMDEIEKAHPDIFSLLLQVMDYATLTDNNGKKADFRNVILVMTSNAGAQDMDRSTIGFGDRTGDTQAKGADAVKKLFSPEFRNRLDGIIQFNQLTVEIMQRVVDKFISELQAQLSEKKVEISLSDSARERLAQKGFDPKFGARPLARVIQEEVKDSLTEEVLFGKLMRGGKALIDFKEGKISIDCISS
ncbi:MAG: ATP-dependent Clp protease ATP-binding subunit ClpA [Nitrospirae bacterium]|nr:MAG: ATP-dependent Clp protease ATP-binding subunit ClpA [Nitrospirota bacterium]